MVEIVELPRIARDFALQGVPPNLPQLAADLVVGLGVAREAHLAQHPGRQKKPVPLAGELQMRVVHVDHNQGMIHCRRDRFAKVPQPESAEASPLIAVAENELQQVVRVRLLVVDAVEDRRGMWLLLLLARHALNLHPQNGETATSRPQSNPSQGSDSGGSETVERTWRSLEMGGSANPFRFGPSKRSLPGGGWKQSYSLGRCRSEAFRKGRYGRFEQHRCSIIGEASAVMFVASA